ncbi:MAG: DMT family transporter [Proteobacteria bacterium]|nr:DMT family transporter [Pseudomonadota bacterium]MDB4825518.1 DMT family transporter [Gammaproteobacteria bacterium]MBT4988178.1 DMT family transporter [Pseudomonadota bacterium]MBT5189335.1 DMT family transporter [Pseudomonadota bacterium]MBT6070271.1 DMT family transporter [Pseudomonadota bacterium]
MRQLAILLMIASSVVISFSGLVVRLLEAGPLVMNFYRALFLMGAILVLLFLRYRGAAIVRVIGVGWPGLMAGAMLAGAGITFLQSMTHTTVANTLFVLGGIPFVTAGLAWIFLKEKPSRPTLVTMIIAFFGIVIMIGEGFTIGSVYGNLMALMTTFFFSIYAVIVRFNRQVDMLPAILISTVLIMAMTGLTQRGELPISKNDLWLCLLWGGVMSGFTSASFIVASRHIVAAELTIFMLLEFALGPVWVWLFVNEIPSKWTLAGGALVIVAVLGRSILELRARSAA